MKHSRTCPVCKSSIPISKEQAEKDKKDFHEAFLSNIKKTESCHLWTGTLSQKGYGLINKNYIRKAAHRYSWEVHTGEEIPGDLFVLHKCDKPSCVNPEHLFLGTQTENMQDMLVKNRKVVGNKKTLTVEQVIEIKKLIKNGVSNKLIAEQFNTSQNNICRIKTNRSWAKI